MAEKKMFPQKDIEALLKMDYNNTGDEVLISDLVMEGLLTAYEMELPEGAEPGCREQLFPALLKGYLFHRKLSREEAAQHGPLTRSITPCGFQEFFIMKTLWKN